MDVTVNSPEVVAEVRTLFERYEQALIDKNVEVLDATFWDSPHTIRYSFNENGYGFAQIHAHRMAVRGQDAIGRQSQTWVRFPGLGWKVVSAHVSTMSAPRS